MEIVTAAALFFALLLLASFGLRVVEGMERENRLVEAELQASRLYRDSLDSRAKQVRRYRHDADGLLRAIECLLENEVNMPAPVFGSRENEANLGFGSGYCQLPLADAAIQSKRRLCAEAGITFRCEVDPGFAEEAMRRRMSEPDLCIVLQNLLDNAYEACVKVADAQLDPMMALWMKVVSDGSLHITVRNRTISSKPPNFRTHKDHREFHGVGMEVVREIAKTHGGAVAVDFNPDTRILCITVRM